MLTQRKLIEREEFPNTVESDLDSWEFHYKKIKENLEGTEEEKQAIIRRRILRYFGEFTLDSENYFSVRLDVEDIHNPFLKIIPNQLLLYGVDYLSISRVKEYFKGYETQIRRIDDSHCLVEFRNQKQCYEAFMKKMDNLQKVKNESSQSGWTPLQPYREFIFERKLMGRYLTNFDRIQNKAPTSRSSLYYAYSEAKRKFFKGLKESLLENKQKDKNMYEKGRQRSRSKQKRNHFDYGNQGPICSGHCACNLFSSHCRGIYNKYNHCQCRCNMNHNSCMRNRNRNRSSSRESIQSVGSLGYESGGQNEGTNRRGRQKLSILQQKMVQDSDYKFQLYVKNRNKLREQKQKKKQENKKLADTSVLILPSEKTTKHYNPFLQNNQFKSQSEAQIQKSSTITNPFIQLFTDNSISKIPQLQNSSKFQNPFNQIDQEINNVYSHDDSMNFQAYLERLKLEDSSQDFSVFDIEIKDD